MKEILFVGPQRKMIKFRVDGKQVLLYDDHWKDGIQIFPFDKKLHRKLSHAKRERLKATAVLIFDANSGKNLEEYEACETEEDIITIIRRESKAQGLLEA